MMTLRVSILWVTYWRTLSISRCYARISRRVTQMVLICEGRDACASRSQGRSSPSSGKGRNRRAAIGYARPRENTHNARRGGFSGNALSKKPPSPLKAQTGIRIPLGLPSINGAENRTRANRQACARRLPRGDEPRGVPGGAQLGGDRQTVGSVVQGVR